MSLIAELKRRKVFKVGGAYLVVAWLAIQAASIAFPTFDAPPWALRVFIFVLLLGFPLTLVISWILEVTPEGLKVEPAPVGTKRVVAIAVVLAALAIGWYFKGSPAFRGGDAGPRALAVLPFATLGKDADSSGLAGGLHDTLITQLSKLKGLEVRSRTSVMKYKDWTGGLKPIANELGVAIVLEGSVQRVGNRTVVNAQLINAQTDAHIWAETIDRSSDDLFALQAEIAQRVVDQLQLALTPAERKALSQAPTKSPEAYALFAQGQRVLHDAELPMTVEERESERKRSAALLETAVARDPEFALAWAALSHAYASVAWNARYSDYHAYADKARVAAQRAIEFGADLPEARFARGSVAMQLDFDFPLAVREFEYAASAVPGNAEFHSRLCMAYRYVGRWADSERSCLRASELDPTDVFYQNGLENALLRLRRMDDVLANARRVAALRPRDYDAARKPALVESWIQADLTPLLSFVREASGRYRKTEVLVDDLWLLGMATGGYAAALAAIDEAPPDAQPPWAAAKRGDALRLLGRNEEAQAAYASERDRHLAVLGADRDPLVEALERASLAYALARLGDASGARENIAKADALWGYARDPADGAVVYYFLLRAQVALGEYDEATAKARVLVEHPTPFTAGWLWISAWTADLHNHAGFRTLMQQHGVDVSREPFAFNRAPKPAAGS